VEKYCRDGQATDDNITWPMRMACWVTNAADTHSEYELLISVPWQHVYPNAPQYYFYTHIACLVYVFQESNSVPDL
jgi:hypothetical protein